MKSFLGVMGRTFSCATVLAAGLGAIGCGDNLSVDLAPRTTPPPLVEPPHNTNPPAEEFFIPGHNFEPPLPSRYVKNANSPRDLVFIPDHDSGPLFFWVAYDRSDYSIHRGDLDGGTSTVAVRTEYRPNSLIGDRGNLFWNSGALIYSYDFEYGTVQNIYDVGEPVTSLALDGDTLFVGTASGQILAGDRGPGVLETLTTGPGAIASLTRQDDDLFVTTFDEGDGGDLLLVDPQTGGTRTLAGGYNFDNGIAIDDDNVYWADPTERAVLGIDREGGEAYTLASRQYQLGSLTVDRFRVYFSTDSDLTVKSVAKTGGSTLSVAGGLYSVNQMVMSNDNRLFMIGSDNIYFLDL